jgi:hypothetical protein
VVSQCHPNAVALGGGYATVYATRETRNVVSVTPVLTIRAPTHKNSTLRNPSLVNIRGSICAQSLRAEYVRVGGGSSRCDWRCPLAIQSNDDVPCTPARWEGRE